MVKKSVTAFGIFIGIFAGIFVALDTSAYQLSVSTSDDTKITLNSGQIKTETSQVTVATDCRAGYIWQIKGPNDTNLYLGGDKTINEAGKYLTPTSPASALDAQPSTYGYNLTTNSISANFTPLTSTAVTLKGLAETASPTQDISDANYIHWGANAGMTLNAGTYILADNEAVTYIVTANPTCINYTVKFEANGGSGQMSNQTIISGVATNLSANAFTAPAYWQSFLSWNTKADGTGKKYTDKESVTDLVNADEEITLYAQWGCKPGDICYIDNGANSPTVMSGHKIASDATSVDLWASNFKRQGYGFAGWNTKEDGTGTKYGPNEAITDAGLIASIRESGLRLYAMWIQSAGDLQDWAGCPTMNIGDVTALTDQRDNNVYAIAKLADGNCWMIENLRLDNTAEHNSDGSLAQGYASNFIGLADPESPWADSNSADSIPTNSLYSLDGSTPATISYIDIGLSQRFPRYNNYNTANPSANMTASDNTNNVYSLGNYYSWAAAIADTTFYGYGVEQNITGTSICPAGWHLPIGSDSATGNKNDEFYKLGIAIVGAEPADSKIYTGAIEGANASKLFRRYPNNFIYSGTMNYSSIVNRGETGFYHTAASVHDGYSRYLSISDNLVYPGTAAVNKVKGRSIRCTITSNTKPGKITYDDNGANSPTTMSDQEVASDATSVDLWASNFRRQGYGFAGWNTKEDGTGTKYGPNEAITDADLIASIRESGLRLYAMWIQSAGDLQDWAGCTTMNIGDVTALTDQRDNNVYAIAKLADGNCWMIENLRLDNEYTIGAENEAKAQGYAKSTTYGNFIGLAEPEATTGYGDDGDLNNKTTANSIYYAETQSGTASVNIASSWSPGWRMPRYNNQNTASAAIEMTGPTDNVYSYGNHYSMPAAIASTGRHVAGPINDTSICPKGWRLPTGESNGEYSALDIAMGGTGLDLQSTFEASQRWRKFPNNFVYSGRINNQPLFELDSDAGYYWTNSIADSTVNVGYYLGVGKDYVRPGTIGTHRYFGFSIRCMISTGTDPSKIYYDDNGANSPTTMGVQDIDIDSFVSRIGLWASNFQRPGYGFAGWNTKADGTGTSYGPNETISDEDTVEYIKNRGLRLYAMWVQSAGDLQGWTGCPAMKIGDVTALTDKRDDNTYAIAKLADGNCWMIENLRLDNTADHNSDGSSAQGYHSSFIGLADTETESNFSNSTTANSLYSTSTITGNNQSYRFPRYSNTNTANPATSMTTNDTETAVYSYGNYYTWSAAVADTSDYTVNNQSVTGTSICPAGWHLPSGGDRYSEDNEMLALSEAVIGYKPANFSSTNYPHYWSTEGTDATDKMRAYPNNLIYSGYAEYGLVRNRGAMGTYWSATINGTQSYRFYIYSGGFTPGTGATYKFTGAAVRCMLASDTEPGKITYDDNGANSPTTMSDQEIASNATSVDLWASNFQRPGYGFAGWNTKKDGTGVSYGPNETIIGTDAIADIKANGLRLYAMWVQSAGNLQNWVGCSAMNIGDVTALTDQRDNDTYAVAKLADGKCWMIENLRLDNTADHNSDGSLAQGYAKSATYGNFSGLAEPETANFEASTVANSLYYSGTQSGTASVDIGTASPQYRFPRYNNQNTASPTNNMTAWNNDFNVYSVGNYYTWSAAVASTENHYNILATNTSICPKGWHLPTGDGTGEFATLDVAIGGTGSGQNTHEAHQRWRKFPNNFIYSGLFGGNVVQNRGSGMIYWSSSSWITGNSYGLSVYQNLILPGTNSPTKNIGGSVRCLADIL